MNKVLLDHIIEHIFSNFGIKKLENINTKTSKSLIDNFFLLKEKLIFSSLEENGDYINNNIYGCQFTFQQSTVKVLLGDCSQDAEDWEFSMIIHIDGVPTYGLFFSIFNDDDSQNLLACTIDGQTWIPCNTYLQATFLAGMEQMKDLFLIANNISNYKHQYDILLSFIKYHRSLCESSYEG